MGIIIPRLYLHSIDLFRGGDGREATKIVGRFLSNGTRYGYKTKFTAVLYHIEHTQGLDKLQLNHDWLQFLQADLCLWGWPFRRSQDFVVPRFLSTYFTKQLVVLLERN